MQDDGNDRSTLLAFMVCVLHHLKHHYQSHFLGHLMHQRYRKQQQIVRFTLFLAFWRINLRPNCVFAIILLKI